MQIIDWLDVNLEMPKDNERVLIWDEDIGALSARHGSAGWFLEGALDRHAKVTHWSHLPGRPKD